MAEVTAGAPTTYEEREAINEPIFFDYVAQELRLAAGKEGKLPGEADVNRWLTEHFGDDQEGRKQCESCPIIIEHNGVRFQYDRSKKEVAVQVDNAFEVEGKLEKTKNDLELVAQMLRLAGFELQSTRMTGAHSFPQPRALVNAAIKGLLDKNDPGTEDIPKKEILARLHAGTLYLSEPKNESETKVKALKEKLHQMLLKKKKREFKSIEKMPIEKQEKKYEDLHFLRSQLAILVRLIQYGEISYENARDEAMRATKDGLFVETEEAAISCFNQAWAQIIEEITE